MKPSEHPDFFRLPPPEGRSRESTIVLDAQGQFFHEGEKVSHPGMAKAFASWISRHPDNGRYILNNGYDWSYFQVEDVPYFVVALRQSSVAGQGLESVPDRSTSTDSLSLELSDGSFEALDPARLELGGEGVLYAVVKGGTFRARFTRTAQLQVSQLLVEDADGGISIDFGSRRTRLAVLEAKP